MLKAAQGLSVLEVAVPALLALGITFLVGRNNARSPFLKSLNAMLFFDRSRYCLADFCHFLTSEMVRLIESVKDDKSNSWRDTSSRASNDTSSLSSETIRRGIGSVATGRRLESSPCKTDPDIDPDMVVDDLMIRCNLATQSWYRLATNSDSLASDCMLSSSLSFSAPTL